MNSLQQDMLEYRRQLQKGMIQKAYRELMTFMTGLRIHLKKVSNYSVSGAIYQGYMDMTYFAIFPETLRNKNLKIAIVFLHESFRFEVWLSGKSKHTLRKYWKLFKEN